MRVVCIYLKKPDDIQSIAEIFYRATPQILLRSPNIIFLEISKCNNLYSEDMFLKRTIVTLKRIQVVASVSIADDIPTALSLAIHPVSHKDSLPIECLNCYIDPLNHFPDKHDVIANAILTFKRLRINVMKDFLKIPGHEISPRFGPLVLLGYRRLRGDIDIPWTEFKPHTVVQEEFEFDLAYPPRDLEPVYFTLRPMLEKIYLRLRGKGRRMRQFQVILQQEYPTQKTQQSYEVTILIPLPFVSVKTIFQITKEKLDSSVQKKPLEHAIVKLSVVITEDAPFMTAQKDIFDQKKEETSEAFFHLVSRMATKLGPDGAFFAHTKENYLPERNWFRVPEKCIDNIQESTVPERPLRLFKEPTPVGVYNNHITINRTSFEILEWKNQEVLLSNWWEISGGERVYYKIHTHTGDNFWIFKNKEQYFLHGVFE